MEGRSQHLSRLIQLRLQMISNIWSWNYRTTRGQEMKGCYQKQLAYIKEQQNNQKVHPESKKHAEHHHPIELMLCQSMCSLHFETLCFLTYGRRLPPSSSRLDHLAKDLEAIQRDVLGLLDGLFCHLLAVHVDLDFLRGDGDVELQGLWGGGES